MGLAHCSLQHARTPWPFLCRRMLCVAFSYRPIDGECDWFDSRRPIAMTLPEGDKLPESAPETERECEEMLQGLEFIGMVAVQRQSREHIVKLIDTLDDGKLFCIPTL